MPPVRRYMPGGPCYPGLSEPLEVYTVWFGILMITIGILMILPGLRIRPLAGFALFPMLALPGIPEALRGFCGPSSILSGAASALHVSNPFFRRRDDRPQASCRPVLVLDISNISNISRVRVPVLKDI